MCGICGIYNLAHEPLGCDNCIERMSRRLEHRGPDSAGFLKLPYLATGNQPLSNESGDVTLVFNGEIYNYRELAVGLAKRGHRFKTHSDGEVIAHLYEEQGLDFVRELNGMFAIALWDARARRLVLARDRAGEKPIHYWQRGNTLVFGSEIKALLEYPGISRRLDPEAVSEYFFYGYFPAPASVFAEIRKLPAAHMLVVENGRPSIHRYWDLRDYLRAPGRARPGRCEVRGLTEELRTRIREASISRLVSDVPLGVFLSGGIDSSTVVANMSELSPGNVSTFSVAFPEKSFNEESYASLVARHFRSRHHVVTADSEGLKEGLEILANHLDEPLADPAIIPTYLLSRFARQHIKVALSGEGSDELFGGYPTYLGARLAAYYARLPKFLRRQFCARIREWLPVSSNAVPKGQFLRRFLTHAEKDPAERHQTWFGMFSSSELDQLFAPGWAGGQAPSQRVLAPMSKILEGAHFDDTIAELLYVDFRMYLEDNLLVKVDRASMACSLELRTPFLDHRLIQFAAGLPADLRVRGFRLKYILKKAVEPWLPRKVVYRQKRGFSVPIARWMREDMRALVDTTLEAEKLRRQGLFNAPFVRRLLEEHWSKRSDHRKTLWTLLCFQLWYERWAGL
jgi:asparagine synthase (glutamine-hydrolysing)